jgi:hypothetical protein
MKVTCRNAPFIKQFGGPGENAIVCFKFWQAVVASGCPGACAYCFLQTQTPYRRGLYELEGTLFSNLAELEFEARRWLGLKRPAGLIVGENQDGLAFERPYKQLLGITPLEILVPLFENHNPVGHSLIVLSRFTTTEFAETFGPSRHVIFSWSLSLPTISQRYEKKVASLRARLGTARRLKSAGWRIRFRLDAMAPIPNWQPDLDAIIAEINSVGPEMLTIGALRATNTDALTRAARRNGRDESIFSYLRDRDPSAFKFRVDTEFHAAVFSRVVEHLHPDIKLGLCKEDASVWQAIGLTWEGCHCLSGASDDVVIERGNPSSLIQDLADRAAEPALR